MEYNKLCYELRVARDSTSDENTREKLTHIINDLEKNGVEENE